MKNIKLKDLDHAVGIVVIFLLLILLRASTGAYNTQIAESYDVCEVLAKGE